MKAVVDRIEGNIAVLLTCEPDPKQLTVPASLLPPGTREGDTVTLSLERDDRATAEARDRVTGLIERLKKGS